jgi:hypothetical protein
LILNCPVEPSFNFDSVINFITTHSGIINKKHMFLIFRELCLRQGGTKNEINRITILLDYFSRCPNSIEFPKNNNLLIELSCQNNVKIMKILIEYSIKNPETFIYKSENKEENFFYKFASSNMVTSNVLDIILNYEIEHPNLFEVNKYFEESVDSLYSYMDELDGDHTDNISINSINIMSILSNYEEKMIAQDPSFKPLNL